MKEVCEICTHPITDPICVDCYLEHARQWLEDFQVSKQQLAELIKKIKSRLPAETLNEHTCILCGRNSVSICMFCSLLRTSEIFNKLDRDSRNTYLESNSVMKQYGDEY